MSKNGPSTEFVNDLIAVLRKFNPKLFSANKPVPFKIGLADDIHAALSGHGVGRKRICRAFRKMTRTNQYLHSCATAGAVRYGLQGPEGEVSEKEAAYARQMLEYRAKRRVWRKQAKDRKRGLADAGKPE